MPILYDNSHFSCCPTFCSVALFVYCVPVVVYSSSVSKFNMTGISLMYLKMYTNILLRNNQFCCTHSLYRLRLNRPLQILRFNADGKVKMAIIAK